MHHGIGDLIARDENMSHKIDMLKTIPQSQNELTEHICAALNEVAGWDEPKRLEKGGWTAAICDALKIRLQRPGVECCFGRNRSIRQDEREWLWDFCVLLFEEQTR